MTSIYHHIIIIIIILFVQAVHSEAYSQCMWRTEQEKGPPASASMSYSNYYMLNAIY